MGIRFLWFGCDYVWLRVGGWFWLCFYLYLLGLRLRVSFFGLKILFCENRVCFIGFLGCF